MTKYNLYAMWEIIIRYSNSRTWNPSFFFFFHIIVECRGKQNVVSSDGLDIHREKFHGSSIDRVRRRCTWFLLNAIAVRAALDLLDLAVVWPPQVGKVPMQNRTNVRWADVPSIEMGIEDDNSVGKLAQ